MIRAGLLTLLVVACDQAGAGIPNPTGSCQPSGDGGRAGYHHPTSSHWLPDCQNPLRREYWRVFALTATSAYTIPRLDGNPWLQPICTDPAHPLSPVVMRYPLCAPLASTDEVDRVNDMAPADALALTHFLHGQLRFVAHPTAIIPQPVPSDVRDACRLHPNGTELALTCDMVEKELRHGFELAVVYEGQAGVELAARLNELYGIK